MRILITRPMADAVPFAKLVQDAGHDAVIEPMIQIRPTSVPDAEIIAELKGVRGLLFTSANGVRALSSRSTCRTLTAWCVGTGSAEAARRAGFASIEIAGGDVERLAAHVLAGTSPSDGPLLHVAGSHRAGNLSGLLAEAGFEVRRLVLYEAVARAALTDQTAKALRSGRIDVLTLFSPRTARLFRELAASAGLENDLSHLTVVSLSQAVDDALSLDVGKRLVSDGRHQEALLNMISGLTG